jgi:hypothetical protein
MSEDLERLNLRTAQQSQILDQYRMNIYNMELRINLVIKMMEEKGVFASGEFDKRWPLYLSNDVGAIGPDGVMEGSMRVNFYGDGGK